MTFRRPPTEALLLLAVIAVPAACWVRAVPGLRPAARPGANFTVEGGTPAQRRAVLAEAEYLRRELSRRYFEEEPAPWGEPCRLAFDPGWRVDGYVNRPGSESQSVVGGPLDEVLAYRLPLAVTRALVAARHGRAPAPWLDFGLADRLLGDGATCGRYDAERHRLARDGEYLPLDRLFRHTSADELGAGRPGVSGDRPARRAQAYSVVGFLADRHVPDARLDPVARLLKLDRVAEAKGWGAALAECYGYESVADCESRWRAWLKHSLSAPRSASPFKPAVAPGRPS